MSRRNLPHADPADAPTSVITVRMPPATHQRCRKVAQFRKLSMNSILQAAIDAAIAGGEAEMAGQQLAGEIQTQPIAAKDCQPEAAAD